MHKHHTRERAPMRRSLTTAISLTLALCMAGPALAQQAPAESSGAAAAADPVTLDNVVVTANKRAENIREVATAVSVLDSQQLENFSSTQMSDYASYVPGLQLQSSGTPGQTQVSMRGIAALSPGSTVGTYLDETPVGSNNLYQQATLYTLDLLPFDVERIEVLRGPQGTLYGAGSMGGLIKYTMVKPDAGKTEFRVGAGISQSKGADDTGLNYRFGMNVPLIDDSLALRASYARNDIAGSIDNLVDGSKDINDGDQTIGRVALRWQGDGSSVQLSAMRQEIDSDNNAAIALDPVTLKANNGLGNFVFVDEPFKKDLDYYSLTVDWDFGFADFVSATSYSDTSTLFTQDLTLLYGGLLADFGLPGKSFLRQTLDMDQFTQEFRLQSKSGNSFEWLVGAFYDKEDGDNHQFIPLTQMDGSPLPPPFGNLFGVLGQVSIPSTYEETAVFGNASYKFNDWFKLGAGVRFSRNDQDFVQESSGPLIRTGTFPNSSSEDVFTWSVTPQFQINPDMMVYAKAGTGYQPGGPNVVAPGLPPAVDSSMLTSYELGMKTSFAENRVLLDVAAYQIDWEDIQVASQVNGVSGLVNGGEATSRGIEASLQWRPLDGLTLGLNGAYNDAEIDEDFPTITVTQPVPGLGTLRADVNTGLKGDRMPYVPDLTWSLTADYYMPLSGGWGANFGGGWRWVDDRTNATTNREVISIIDPPLGEVQRTVTEPLVIDSYGALDLYASFSNEHWSVRAYMKNVTDERGYSSMNDITDQVGDGGTHHIRAVPIQPRMFGVEVDYRF
ncbi:TonB-dependent receptor [Lysobacter niastensis]|uniref:TonB-dependent receptor n=1 Tax=Lysobacter niastensis TaxID=380629 RepID=A0ABS0B596_9GAMM|nr:TonB-dependent receptor [Lysobacter niastensis]MBF6023981.1 TonB-dependent receptor [Lysobacter niastensis]